MNTLPQFLSTCVINSRKDLVGLVVYWLVDYNGEEVAQIQEIGDIMSTYDIHMSNIAIANRVEQLRDDGLAYYRERTGESSGYQLTEQGYRRYDQLSNFMGSAGDTLPDILSPRIKSQLEHSTHGGEVETHLREGDKCYHENLFHPALNSYIHAIEWAFIAYLEIYANIDIIVEEQSSGTNYYFAGRNPNLLDEVQNHNSPLTQKSESWIESRNRAERRWIAHHKSGSTLKTEVKNTRDRLGVILNELFQ